MDYPGRRVYARRVDVDYYTEAEVEAEVRVLALDRELPRGRARLCFGAVEVRKIVPMYKKIRFYTRENIGAGDVHLPPEELDTEGLAVVFPRPAAGAPGVPATELGRALQAFAELCRHVVPLWVRCAAADLGTAAEACASHFGAPTVYLWDEVPGGVGLAEKALEEFPRILEAMREIVGECGCAAGCPACIGPSLGDGVREKQTVLALLDCLAADRPVCA
jgi:DEAD/DEAH box helicase domain-containing protein